MATYRKAYAAKLTNLLVQGSSVAEAARDCDLSEDTVRRFQRAHWDEIRELQQKTTAGVLDALKELLPRAVKRLETELDKPHASSADVVRVIRTVISSWEAVREVDFEVRLKALEKGLEEQRSPHTSTS